MARIYTRTGDGGDTSLGDGSRVPKSAPRIDLYGDLDELNSLLGMCLAFLREGGTETALTEGLERLQSRLFDLGTILADPVRSRETAGLDPADQPFATAELESLIDLMDDDLSPLKNFILPGGTRAASVLHLARTVCRRTERKAVALSSTEDVPSGAIAWINRLSDLLFTAARWANASAGKADIPWLPNEG